IQAGASGARFESNKPRLWDGPQNADCAEVRGLSEYRAPCRNRTCTLCPTFGSLTDSESRSRLKYQRSPLAVSIGIASASTTVPVIWPSSKLAAKSALLSATLTIAIKLHASVFIGDRVIRQWAHLPEHRGLS